MSRRWLLRVLLLWPLVPIPIYVVVVGGWVLSHGQIGVTLREFVLTFFTYGSILVPAWLASCLVGFGLGAIVRRLRRRAPSTALATGAPPAL